MVRSPKDSDTESPRNERGDFTYLSQSNEGPSFFPALVTQRRTFCVEVLKKEGIHTVAELGCGEGSLLGLLSQPASHLDAFPPIESSASSPDPTAASEIHISRPDQSLSSEHESLVEPSGDEANLASRGSEQTSVKGDESGVVEDKQELYQFLRQVPTPLLYETQLHLRNIFGLDIREDRLELASQCVAPPPPEATTRFFGSQTRWEPLTVELWHGSLIHYNENFKGVDCIVMSEVIEHLPPEVFDKFIPIVFAAYNPRVIVITTPNHDFNRYFDTSTPQSASYRFPDPTGRTSRVFRDDDHKFEWTEDEFKGWCDSTSQQYEYDVEITGCGSHANYFGRYSMDCPSEPSSADNSFEAATSPTFAPPAISSDSSSTETPPSKPDQFFATQCAIFRRNQTSEPKQSSDQVHSAPALTDLPGFDSSPRLFGRYVHPVNPHADKPSNSEAILDEVREAFKDSSRISVDLRELWFTHPRIPELCGGHVNALVSSLMKAKGEWSLRIQETRRGLDAVVVDWDLAPPDSPYGSSSDESESGEFLRSSDRFEIEVSGWTYEDKASTPGRNELADKIDDLSWWGEAPEPRERFSTSTEISDW